MIDLIRWTMSMRMFHRDKNACIVFAYARWKTTAAVRSGIYTRSKRWVWRWAPSSSSNQYFQSLYIRPIEYASVDATVRWAGEDLDFNGALHWLVYGVSFEQQQQQSISHSCEVNVRMDIYIIHVGHVGIFWPESNDCVRCILHVIIIEWMTGLKTLQ